MNVQRVLPDWRPRKPPRSDFGIGLVGVGFIGRAQLAAYREEGLNVRALCDIDKSALEKAGREFGIETLTADYRQLLADPRIDIIDVTTIPEVRRPIILDAAAAGKHLLIQKPLAHTVSQAKEYQRAIEKAAVLAAVNQTERWSPRDGKVIALVRNGFLGELQSEFVYEVMNCDDLYGGPSWRGQLEHFAIRELTIHNVETFRAMSGQDPIRVLANGAYMPGQRLKSQTLTNVIVEFPDQKRYYEVMQLAVRGRIDERREMVFGTHGTVEARGPEITVFLGDETWNIPCSESYNSAYLGGMYDLMRCLETAEEPPTSIRRNLPTVAAIEAAAISLKTGQPVAVASLLFNEE